MVQKTLQTAKKQKKDEFYTRYDDIASELRHYKEQFRGKIVFCNCDDPYESNFFKFFANNFNAFGLKKLLATSYNNSPVAGIDLPLFQIAGAGGKQPIKIEISEVPDTNGDGAIDLGDVEFLLRNNKNVVTPLIGTGDFRSEESIELLKQADIVVTNPPFSLFREYLAKLVEYNKKFLIIGNKNAITYKEVFKLIKDNMLWLGYRNINSDMWFEVPSGENYEKIVDGVKVKHIMACWFTNLETSKRHEEFVMYKKYRTDPQYFPTYDNFDAININVVAEIPGDYAGVMGVPITFLDKYNPDQFELLGQMVTTKVDDFNFGYPYIGGKKIYARILVSNRKPEGTV